MDKFSGCLEQGQFYERELLKYLDYDTFRTSKQFKNFKDWDIEITKDNKTTTYEVKSETTSFKTKNMCIEYSYKNMPSGINATKADYFAHFCIENKEKNIYTLYIIPVCDLKELIKNRNYFRNMRGGDGGYSEFYLFKLEKMSKYKIDESEYRIKELLDFMDNN
jgi:hypothetical protein